MNQNIIHIGLNVDDTQYHGSAFNKDTGEVVDFKSRPTLKGLLQQLDRMARRSLRPTNAVIEQQGSVRTWSPGVSILRLSWSTSPIAVYSA